MGFALRIGLLLSQGSEFGFVILGLSASLGVLNPDLASVLIAAIGISLALTPALEATGTRLANHFESRQAVPATTPRDTSFARVLIAGFGTTGRTVARALDAADIDYVAVEGDRGRFAQARCEGFNVSFGNATQMSLLDAAGAGNACRRRRAGRPARDPKRAHQSGTALPAVAVV
jgi:CPA2 family monovalent cation:H+ antiporter-2